MAGTQHTSQHDGIARRNFLEVSYNSACIRKDQSTLVVCMRCSVRGTAQRSGVVERGTREASQLKKYRIFVRGE